MVAQLGRTGRRGGGGFYQEVGGKRSLWSGLREHFARAEAQPAVTELVDRLLVIQAVEAARCMEEGILQAAIDADVGAILGWGFAPWTGGPLAYIDTIGVAAFVQRADALADRFGDRYCPPASLRTMAAEGRRFGG
jgi:3-hydroxyacyl-CoA dehydrogenase/enoyl-CoA hydratase/3-hydroxybutyryl-CoA epimerase